MDKEFKLEIPTIEEIYDYIVELAYKIKSSKINYDVIIGVARGGIIPARIIGDLLLIKDIRIIHAKYYEKPYQTLEKPVIEMNNISNIEKKKILLVDDVADTGDTISEVIHYLIEKGAELVDTAVIYIKPWNKAGIKYYVKLTDAWIVFPWEFLETAIQLLNGPNRETFINEIKKKPSLKRILDKFLE